MFSLTFWIRVSAVLAIAIACPEAKSEVVLSFSSVPQNVGAADYTFHVYAKNTLATTITIESYKLPFDVKDGFTFGGLDDYSVLFPADSDGQFSSVSVATGKPQYDVLFEAAAIGSDDGLRLDGGITGKLFTFTLAYDGGDSGVVEAASLITTVPGSNFTRFVVDGETTSIRTMGLSPSIGVTAVPEPSTMFATASLGAFLLLLRWRRRFA